MLWVKPKIEQFESSFKENTWHSPTIDKNCDNAKDNGKQSKKIEK